MDFNWQDISSTESVVLTDRKHDLLRVRYDGAVWHITVLDGNFSTFTINGQTGDLFDAKLKAESQLKMFMDKWGFSLHRIQLPDMSPNFRTGRTGLIHEIKQMQLLLRRVAKQVIRVKLNRKLTPSMTIDFDKSVAEDVFNYLMVKDKVFMSRKDILRIVTLGHDGKIKNIDWTKLIERFKE